MIMSAPTAMAFTRSEPRLAPLSLDALGLAATLEGLVRDSQRRHPSVALSLRHDLPVDLGPSITLAIYRVVQEALRNAVKHSRVQQIKVELRAGSNDLQLSVCDSGVGFDPSAALLGKGLGLVSMQERLRLVNGELTVRSAPDVGTAIQARVPLR
jgi:two-component system sensor histidine kinase UhpB